jgi:hypothetical protein
MMSTTTSNSINVKPRLDLGRCEGLLSWGDMLTPSKAKPIPRGSVALGAALPGFAVHGLSPHDPAETEGQGRDDADPSNRQENPA